MQEPLLPTPLILRVARRFQAAYFNTGDVVLYGKYKNHRGKIVGFGQDKWGNPTVEIEPIPKGRKQNKTFGLFKIWRADVKEEALKKQEQEAASKVAFLYLARTLGLREIAREFSQVKPRIEALVREGKSEEGKLGEARELFLKAVQPMQGIATSLQGVVVQRPDEQRKLKHVQEQLRYLRRTIKDELPSDPIELGVELLYRIDSLSDILRSLARVEDRIEQYQAVEKVFAHGPYTVENKHGFRADEYPEALDVLDKATALVQKSGFGAVAYGTVVLETSKKGEWGYGYAGFYSLTGDYIRLNVSARHRFNEVYTLVHELGHRYWHKVMNEAARDTYEEAYAGTASVSLTVAQRETMWEEFKRVGGNPKEVRLPPELREVFPAYYRERVKAVGKPDLEAPRSYLNFVMPNTRFYYLEGASPVSVTDYGETNVGEDFAEVFAHYVTGEQIQADALARFKAAIS